MFSNSGSIQQAMERLVCTKDSQSFQAAISALKEQMKRTGIDSQYLIDLERRAYYLPNEYSDKDTKEKMLEAKKRVIEYMNEIMNVNENGRLLLDILENFYLFLENLFERRLHKRGGIQKEQLEGLRIKNEYDVQHLLYAYLKPLYPMARAEVNEDTGYGTVRTDILLDSENTIEVKCTRKGMVLKKLVEEIEADMVHYSAKNIYFFIYDKEKLIDNLCNFKSIYEEKMKDKHIYIIIHQPKIL